MKYFRRYSRFVFRCYFSDVLPAATYFDVFLTFSTYLPFLDVIPVFQTYFDVFWTFQTYVSFRRSSSFQTLFRFLEVIPLLYVIPVFLDVILVHSRFRCYSSRRYSRWTFRHYSIDVIPVPRHSYSLSWNGVSLIVWSLGLKFLSQMTRRKN